MTDIRAKLDVASKLANAETNFQEEIPLEDTASDDVADQVAQYFNLDHEAEATVATTASYSD